MGDVFAIVSKAVFEKEARVDGEVVDVGGLWPVDRYNNSNKVFETNLEDGGRIFMVTVRPPDESLWLLAVLENPKFNAKAKAWVATANTVPVTDISSLRKSIKFESGKGMSQDKGALGMSLQTPRALGDGDADQILALTGGGKPGKKSGATAKGAAKAEDKPAAKAAVKVSTRSRDRISALLSAINEEPDDAMNRHVLADAYDASGDADRANFIRSQIARSEIPSWDPRAVAMGLDERALLRDHEAAWRKELPALKGAKYGAFERGLVSWLLFDDAAQLTKHVETARAATPITRVMMRWPRRGARPKLGAIAGLKSLVVTGTLLQNADLKWLAGSAVLSTLEDLTLHHSNLDDEALGILLESPHLGKLRRLRLPFHQLSNEGIGQLAEANLPKLVELGLGVETADRLGSGGRDGEGINGEGIQALCKWPQMAYIEKLDLTGIQLGEAGLTELLTSKNTKRLTSLRLRSVSDYDMENDERPDVLTAFQALKGDRTFEELDVGENELSADGVKGLIGAPALAKLKVFSYDFHQSWGPDRLGKLLDDAKWLDEVHVMSMTDTTLPMVKKLLGRAPKSLHTLDVSSMFPRSSCKGIGAALIATKLPALQSIDLLGCEISDAELKKLGGTKNLPALLEIRMGPNDSSGYNDDDEGTFSEDVAEAFLESALGKQLKSAVFGLEKIDRLPAPETITLDGGDDDDEDYDDDDDE